MGTTTSALLIAGDRAFIAHVGDSRIYMLRAGQVVQLTEDHSLVNELIRRGRVTKEGFETSPYKAYKNAVTRAVGVYETVQGDTIDFEILPGDQFLLCSDGLHAYLNDQRIIDMPQGGRRQARSPRSSSTWRTRAAGTTTSPPSSCASRGAGGGGRAGRRSRRGAGAQGRRAAADAALPAPHLQGDPARPQRHAGARVRGRRGDHQGGDARRRDVHPAARQDPAAQERRVHHPPRARARTSARWRSSTAASRARPAPPPRSARAC